MYIIEYADGAIALVSDLHSVQISHSHQSVLERLEPGSAHTVANPYDDGMTVTRLPDTILTRDGRGHGLGEAVQTLLRNYRIESEPRFTIWPNLRSLSVAD